MSNSTLFLIVVVEAIIIIWLFSKLKHYQKFEKLLSNQLSGTSELPQKSQEATKEAPEIAFAGDDTQVNSATDLDTAADGVPEENIEEAKRVQWVMARCRYAEFYLEQLDDDYERGQFRHIIDGCVAQARRIADPFFKDSALYPIIVLLDRAGWESYRDSLLTEVQDEIIRQKIEQELSAEESA